jgi:hypothetical protein
MIRHPAWLGPALTTAGIMGLLIGPWWLLTLAGVVLTAADVTRRRRRRKMIEAHAAAAHHAQRLNTLLENSRRYQAEQQAGLWSNNF